MYIKQNIFFVSFIKISHDLTTIHTIHSTKFIVRLPYRTIDICNIQLYINPTLTIHNYT